MSANINYENTDYHKLRFPLNEIIKHNFKKDELFNYNDYLFDKTGDFIFHKRLLEKGKYKQGNKNSKESSKNIRLLFYEYWDKSYFDSDFQRMGFNYDTTTEYTIEGEITTLGYEQGYYFHEGILFNNGEIVSKFIWCISSFWSYYDYPITRKKRCIVENIKCNSNEIKEFNDIKYAIADIHSNLVSDWYDFFSHSDDWIDEKYILAKKDENYGIVDFNGNIIVDFIYDWGNWDYERNSRYERLRIYKGKEYETEYIGLFAWTGNLVIEAKYKKLIIITAFGEFWTETDNIRLKYIKEMALKTDFVLLEDYDDNLYHWSFILGLIKTHKLYKLNKEYPISDFYYRKHFESVNKLAYELYYNDINGGD